MRFSTMVGIGAVAYGAYRGYKNMRTNHDEKPQSGPKAKMH